MASKRFSVDAVFRGIDKISKPARGMGRSISKFVRKSNQKIAKLGRNFKRLGSFMGKAIIGGAGVAVAAMGAAVVKTAELGDEAAKTSRRLGITAESLQELRFAADRQGVSSKLLDSSFTALQKRVGELKAGTGSLYAFLNKTGNKTLARQLNGAKNSEEAFKFLTEAINKIEDPQKRAALASAAFSRAGIDMIKFMEAGTDGISKLRQEARKYGAVISNDAAANSELFIDAMTNFKAVTAGVGLTLGSKLMPHLTTVIQGLADFWAMNKGIISTGIDRFLSFLSRAFKFMAPIVTRLFNVFSKLFKAIFTAAKSLLPSFTAETDDMKKGVFSLVGALEFMAKAATKAFEFIAFISPFLKPFITTLLIYKGVLIAIAIVTKGVAAAQAIYNAVLAANPIGLAVIAIAALIAGIVLLVQNWDTVVAAIKSGAEKIWTWFSGLLDNPFFAVLSTIFLPFITIPAIIVKHWEPIKAFFSGIWDSLTAGFGEVMKIINGVISKIESIPGVKAAIELFTKDQKAPDIKTPGAIKTPDLKIKPAIPEKKEDEEKAARPVTPQERLSRSIEENTSRQITETENNSTLTIQDKTGRAELSPQKRGGPKIALSTSGGL